MATARRLTELGVWNCIVLWSEGQEQPEAAQYKPKLVLRSPGSDAMDFKFLRNHLARQAFQALGERNIVAEYLHGKDQYCHMESLHIGAAVFSVVVPSASSRDMRALPNYVNGRAPSPLNCHYCSVTPSLSMFAGGYLEFISSFFIDLLRGLQVERVPGWHKELRARGDVVEVTSEDA